MMSERREWQSEAGRLARSAIAEGSPTAWFDRLYRAAAAGEVTMPWDRTEPHPLLAGWVDSAELSGDGARAVVVGCGLGADAAYVASLGFETTGFDISETAISVARARYGDQGITFAVADLFDLPSAWAHSFDFVVEIFTVQALPDPPRAEAMAHVSRLVGPGGRLIAVEFRSDDSEAEVDGPPWPLTRAEIDAFGADRLDVVRVAALSDARWPGATFWLAEFTRR
jgi:SAM-dependent methyltransferase